MIHSARSKTRMTEQDDERWLSRDSTAGLKVLNDVDLLRNDPMAFVYAWRGTAVMFSLIWTLVVAICVSFVQYGSKRGYCLPH